MELTHNKKKSTVKHGNKYCEETYWCTLATFVSYISLVPFNTLKKNQDKQNLLWT